MSVNELLQTVRQLDNVEFELFYHQLQTLRSIKRPSAYSLEEQHLLEKIDKPFPRKKLFRFNYLIAKRDMDALSKEGYQELLALTEAFENKELRRLKLLTKLADIKKISLPEVIKYYNIRPLTND